jgi:hypothetical protein
MDSNQTEKVKIIDVLIFNAVFISYHYKPTAEERGVVEVIRN